MRLLLASLVIALTVTTTTGQRQPTRRLVTCRVTEIQQVLSPEAQVMINDTIQIAVACRNHPRLEIPQHKWPFGQWGVPEVGRRVRFIDYGDGRRWLPVRAGR